jgi:FtsP/CotA-like multicopper oxidase with cupredoxin domain
MRAFEAVIWGILAPGVFLAGPAARPATLQTPTSTSPPAVDRIHTNDNRWPAGTWSDTTLTLHLEVREGHWYPDGDRHPGVIVRAFAEAGKPLQVPAPLIRVRQGVTVTVSVRNTLVQPLAIYGLSARDGNSVTGNREATMVAAGATASVTFNAGKPGTYYYWASTNAATALADRLGADGQLTGAIVVDPDGATLPTDRVLVITSWDNAPVGSAGRRFRFAINGGSWPQTERLDFAVGETVRMRVINAGGGVHPMHLHGFYFNVDSRGTEHEDTIFPAGSSPRMVVTERLIPGNTFSLTWTPTRPGNWLFHCHDNVHLDYGGPLDGRPPAPRTSHSDNHALEMMAGPVMGISIRGKSREAPEPPGPRRQLRLVARVDEGGTDTEPAFGYTLHDGGSSPNVTAPFLPGPTMLLKRGEPVSITVENQLPEATAVHWHGIELESYYDGVAGYAGEGSRLAPPSAPGGSFEARFTPPRAGTFIYHTHLDDTRQQQAGLSGALLVVDDPASYDPARDLVLMISVPRQAADSARVLINGSLTPTARQFRVGERYRLRFVNIHTFRPSMRLRLLRGDSLLTWQSLAKDGMELPLDQRRATPSEIQMGNGETYDFEFVPAAPGDMRLDVTAGDGTLLASMPIRVS